MRCQKQQNLSNIDCMVCIQSHSYLDLNPRPLFIYEKKSLSSLTQSQIKIETHLIKIVSIDPELRSLSHLVYLPSLQVGLAIPKIFVSSSFGKSSQSFSGVVFLYLTVLAFRKLFLKSNLYLPSYNLNLLFLAFLIFEDCYQVSHCILSAETNKLRLSLQKM